jgi:D-tagatose-1,6-bisphosphate aldolase subunit GatZ/KbaZ
MRLADRFQFIGSQHPPTMLGIGPMSPTVVTGALRAAADADAPLVFVASRNQVDSDALGGGYVAGWNQRRLAAYVRSAARRWPQVRWYLERDHGGPWQRDDEYRDRLSWPKARARALRSFADDVDAGFHCLHIDVSKDPHRADVPVELGVERIVDLMGEIETRRRRDRSPPVDYEVSLQQCDGGTSDPASFEAFVDGLADAVRRRGLPLPLFVVGNTGTLTRLDDNLGAPDLHAASELARVAGKHGMVLKEHNADYLPTESLLQHGEAGIGMANVAPEFGRAETLALLLLADREPIDAAPRSQLRDVLGRCVGRSDRWHKWLTGPVGEATDEVRARIVEVGGHYVFAATEVKNARRILFDNCRSAGISHDPRADVEAAVARAVSRYLHAFAAAPNKASTLAAL